MIAYTDSSHGFALPLHTSCFYVSKWPTQVKSEISKWRRLIHCKTTWKDILCQEHELFRITLHEMIFIADLIACSTCFGHHYAHHQELESTTQVVAACRIWCFGFQVVGMVWSWGLCVWFAGCWLCPSSAAREYYTSGCCLSYLVLWFSSCWYGVELRVMCLVCGLLIMPIIRGSRVLYKWLLPVVFGAFAEAARKPDT